MYAAKERGKGCRETYQPELDQAHTEHASSAAELAEAITAGRLHLLYQPIVRLPDGRLHGVALDDEGVETAAQAAQLYRMGYRLAQGFTSPAPMDPAGDRAIGHGRRRSTGRFAVPTRAGRAYPVTIPSVGPRRGGDRGGARLRQWLNVLVQVEDVARVVGVLERGQPGQLRRRVGAADARRRPRRRAR